MADINNQNLFAEVTTEESSTVSGGTANVSFNLNSYLFGLGAGLQFGNPGLTPAETQVAWERALFTQEIIPFNVGAAANRVVLPQ